MMRRATVHIVGAGFSGLSAAVHLSAASDVDIVVHERAVRAGGRRRSFYDEAMGLTIDSGNYFVLSSWRSSVATIAAIGAAEQWREEASAEIPFADMFDDTAPVEKKSMAQQVNGYLPYVTQGCLVLLRLHRLALPTSRHPLIINSRASALVLSAPVRSIHQRVR